MKTTLTVQEYADLKRISVRAVQKAISKGKLDTKEVPHPCRKDQKSFLIYVTGQSGEPLSPSDELTNLESDEPKFASSPVANQNSGELLEKSGELTNLESDEPLSPDPVTQLSEAPPDTPPLCPSVPLFSKSPSVDAPPDFIPLHKMQEAQLFALFLEEVDRLLEEVPCKATAWARITSSYNSRDLVPDLHRLKGPRTERALRHWHQKWIGSNHDMFALIHANTSSQRGRKVTEFEQNFLHATLLNDKKVSITSAIMAMKADAQLGLCESPSSVPTLKRWVQDFAAANPDTWAQARHGSKFVKDTIVKSIMRDTSMLKPGDVLVADGHTLAFDVVSPVTGKPARLTLILLYDWASRYPVGASLALTESSAHVLTAVRNSILHLGRIEDSDEQCAGLLPKFIYFDNGKAFRSKLFNAKWEDHDLAAEFAGIFPRLGIQAEFAAKYNARTKVIERFFLTMQEGFERFQGSFRGRNIDDKPANLSRNEKWAQKMYSGRALAYDEALNLTYYYFRYKYGLTPHPALNGQKPYEFFVARSLDPARSILPSQLNFLMLKAERKKLRSEGIWLNKCRYYHDDMIKHVGQPVIIRYDYADLRWIFVYDLSNRFICQAEMRQSQNGFVYLDNNPIAHQALVTEIRHNNRLRRRIESSTAALVKSAQTAVASELAKHRHIKDGLMDAIASDGGNPTFKQPPMITAPVETPTVQTEVARLAAIARASELEADPALTNVIPVAPDSAPAEDPTPTPAVNDDFLSMLRRKGIGH